MTFKLGKINVIISYYFLCSATIFIAVDNTGLYLPSMACILIHELAHLIFLLIFGCRVTNLNLLIGTIGVDYNNYTVNRWQELTAVLAGPLCNLIIGFVCYCFSLYKLFGINVVLAVYNLLPINGLDGGNIVKILLSGKISENAISTTINIFTIILVTLIITIYFVFDEVRGNFTILLFSIYLLLPLLLKKC